MKKRRLLRGTIAIFMIAVMCLTITGCGKKEEKAEVPFFEKYNFEVVGKEKMKYELPIVFYAQNAEGDPIEVEGLEFVPNKMTYEFTNWEKSEPDEDGNVTISITYEMNSEIEYRLPKTNTIQWYYNYYYNNPFAFDYYTGEIYKSTTVSNTSKTYSNGIEQTEEDYQWTDVVWNGKTIKVGSVSHFTFDGWKDKEAVADDEAYYHYKTPISATTVLSIKIPKDYDGVMIALNKNGATKKDFDEDMKLIEKTKALKKQAEESGEKSEELKQIEESNKKVHKLIDQNDEKRKDMKPEDYYIIRINDMFKGE